MRILVDGKREETDLVCVAIALWGVEGGSWREINLF